MPYTNPDGLVGATYCAEDGHCDPHGIATGYLAAARRHGVELRRATPAIGIRREGRPRSCRRYPRRIHRL